VRGGGLKGRYVKGEGPARRACRGRGAGEAVTVLVVGRFGKTWGAPPATALPDHRRKGAMAAVDVSGATCAVRFLSRTGRPSASEKGMFCEPAQSMRCALADETWRAWCGGRSLVRLAPRSCLAKGHGRACPARGKRPGFYETQSVFFVHPSVSQPGEGRRRCRGGFGSFTRVAEGCRVEALRGGARPERFRSCPCDASATSIGLLMIDPPSGRDRRRAARDWG
jgi:hypothetical protein